MTGRALLCCALQLFGAAAWAETENLTLVRAEQLFEQHSRELLLARKAVEAAEADSVSAAARTNPNLALSATQLGNLYPPGYNYSRFDRRADVVIGVNRLFERGNKRELRTAAAKAEEQATRYDLGDAQRTQTFALRAAYYDLVRAQDKVRISALTAASYSKTLDAVALRLKAGDIAAADVARIEVDALRAENDARAARAEREKAQTALAYLIGWETRSRDIEAADPWPAVSSAPAAAELEGILNGRPDVAAAQARLQSAEEKRKLALALRTRDITGSVQFEHVPWNPLANPTAVNTLGFALSIPLFTNYYYQGEIRRAEADLDAARAYADKVRALARGEIESSRADLLSASDRVQRFDGKLLKQAQAAASAAEFAYGQGAIGVMDLLDARRQLYLTRLEASNTRADYANAYAAWRAATEPPSMKTQ